MCLNYSSHSKSSETYNELGHILVQWSESGTLYDNLFHCWCSIHNKDLQAPLLLKEMMTKSTIFKERIWIIICFINDLGGESGKWDHEGLSKERKKHGSPFKTIIFLNQILTTLPLSNWKLYLIYSFFQKESFDNHLCWCLQTSRNNYLFSMGISWKNNFSSKS